MNNDHGDNGDALLLINVTEETRYDLLALGVRQDLDEGMLAGSCVRVDRFHYSW